MTKLEQQYEADAERIGSLQTRVRELEVKVKFADELIRKIAKLKAVHFEPNDFAGMIYVPGTFGGNAAIAARANTVLAKQIKDLPDVPVPKVPA